MTAPHPSPTSRDLRRRQRQVSAYLSELRAAHGRDPSRLSRMLRPAGRSMPGGPNGRPPKAA